MPRLTDIDDIRARLRRDPVWSAYALCDLAPQLWPKTHWFAPGPTLVLHEYGTSILFSLDPASVREALDVVTWPVHLQVRADAYAEVQRYVVTAKEQEMWRMSWVARDRATPRDRDATRLGADHIKALRVLYSDGDATGEAPDFFIPSQVSDGVFYGLFEGDDLIAAAGTHVVCRAEGAATVGNVYTRRDRRGRGLSRRVTAAVLREVADVEVVALNVRADNDIARHVYESLGFERYCRFFEAMAIGWRQGAHASPRVPPLGPERVT